MSGDPLHYEGALRRIRSTGDIQATEIQRPPLARISVGNRRSEGHADAGDGHNSLRDGQTETVTTPSVSRGPQSAEPILGHMWSIPSTVVEAPEGTHTAPPLPPQQTLRPNNLSLYSKALAFFGHGRGASRARRSFVTLVGNLAWGVVQVIAIIALLIVAAVRRSPTQPELTEWKACARPLGIWCCIWIGRVLLVSGLAYCGYVRNRLPFQNRDTEAGGSGPTQPANSAGRIRPRPARPDTANARTPTLVGDTPETPVPPNQLYSRLNLLGSLLTLTWFLTVHILEYTSVNTCRHSSPHLWWLVFGILCIMYLTVLEVVILGFVVFIIAPILFLFWNILLICLGRHPLQNPTAIKPEIGKLPKFVVEQIPLVLYIPPPPDEAALDAVKVPAPAYSYPPTSPSTRPPPKRRFMFLRSVARKRCKTADGAVAESSKDAAKGEKAAKGQPEDWEDRWEQSEYPFVRLEGNRAACAICLMDFEEPKRIAHPDDIGQAAETGDDSKSPKQEAISEEEREDQLRLADAGEGAQPLRLLACGHVFHKTCVDPWLTDVSGRCPVCQRAVEIPEAPKKPRGRRRRYG